MSKTISRESDTHLMVSFVIYMAFLKWEAVSFVGCQLFSLTTFFSRTILMTYKEH